MKIKHLAARFIVLYIAKESIGVSNILGGYIEKFAF